jgi:NhaA family Na+:H+ antiporter
VKSKAGVAERFPILLLLIAIFAILLSKHGSLNFFDTRITSLGMTHTWREWIAIAPLSIFFFVAGLELRSEILSKGRALLIPTAAAVGGMALPALIYISLAHVWSFSGSGWGVPMATDLPLVLAVIALLPPLRQSALRPFLLTLAIVDDGLSILVVAVKFHTNFDVKYLLLSLLAAVIYGFLMKRAFTGVSFFAGTSALLTWYFCAQSGIHPTVAGVLLGLLTFRITESSVKKFWEPLSNYVIVPLFVFSIFAISADYTWSAISSHESISLVIARIVGKPMGIILFAIGATILLRHRLELSRRDLIFAGFLATLGLSVSLLFAQLSLSGSALSLAIIGTVMTIPIALIAIAALYFLTRATAA